MNSSGIFHFQDSRPPQDVRQELEGELMELFRAHPQGPLLTWSARIPVAGAPHDLTLRFEGAGAWNNSYSLRIEPVDPGSPLLRSDSYPGTLRSWFRLWTRNFKASAPPPPAAASSERYRTLADSAREAEAQWSDVRSIQQEILRRLRAGACFSTAHKEGGTLIRFDQGAFVRSDYGESSGCERFQDPDRFLSFLRQFYDWETSRNIYPSRVSDVVAWKLILRLLQRDERRRHAGGSARAAGSAELAFLQRFHRLRSTLAMAVLIGAAALTIVLKGLGVKGAGAPLGVPQQISPHSNSVAFPGTPPRVPDRLLQPVLTIPRNDLGATSILSR